jgi:uncharacterized protein YjbI with pentapeptide repeats
MLKKYTQEELSEILRLHKEWIDSDMATGVRADLTGADLSSNNLKGCVLRHAILSGTDLSCCNLKDSDLSYADLSGTDLSCSNLNSANLECCNLIDSDLSCCNLGNANLMGADVRNSDMSSANLSDANTLYAKFDEPESSDKKVVGDTSGSSELAAYLDDFCKQLEGLNSHYSNSTHSLVLENTAFDISSDFYQ